MSIDPEIKKSNHVEEVSIFQIEYEPLKRLLFSLKAVEDVNVGYFRGQQELMKEAPNNPKYTYNSAFLEVRKSVAMVRVGAMKPFKQLEKELYNNLVGELARALKDCEDAEI